MGIVRFSLRWPYTFYVLALLILFLGVTAIRWHTRAVCTPPLPCAEGGTAILDPW